MLHDLNAILDYVAELNELDTSASSAAQVSELLGVAAQERCAPICAGLAGSGCRDGAGAGDGSGLLQGAQGD